jgi:hypothetical protein
MFPQVVLLHLLASLWESFLTLYFSSRSKLMPQAPRRDVKRLLDLNGLQLRYRCVCSVFFYSLDDAPAARILPRSPAATWLSRSPPSNRTSYLIVTSPRYFPADDNISVIEVGGGISNGAKFLSKSRVRKGTGRE